MSKKRVLMAMSGGVDSSLAAALLLEQGFDLIGITVRGWSPPNWQGEYTDKACCSLAAVEDARAVAYSLGIPFYTLNMADAFWQYIVQPFITSYSQGLTPNPCILCNKHIRFDLLYRKALELECDAVATGHFARIKDDNGQFSLYRGVDALKDQSYMLYTISQKELAMTIYPLGEMTKPEVRSEAAKRNLRTAQRSESQDICFVPDGNYAKLVKEFCPEAATPGPIIYRNGRKIGEHRGLCYHTVGQRKGLGIAWTEPLYVCELDVQQNALIVAEHNYLLQDQLIARDINWINETSQAQLPLEVEVKIRYGSKQVPAELFVLAESDNACIVKLKQAQFAVSPGQAIVFYKGDQVLGGGTISNS